MTKKLFNEQSSVVDEALKGLIALNPSLNLIENHRIVYCFSNNNEVSLISGGGSGHEPSHYAMVGHGMLTAAVCGDVFASPSSSQVYAAIQACKSTKGVLLIVKNYTGDRLQFGKAAERAIKLLGINVKLVVCSDDCAISDEKTSNVGRRGLAGSLFLHKSIGTVGVGLSPCSLFNAAPNFTISDDEMELGLGIHGEKGLTRMKLTTSRVAVDLCIDRILDNAKFTLQSGDSIALLVNNLGSTTALEIGIIVHDCIESFNARKLNVSRIFSGPLMTSLEMSGFSISILKLSQHYTNCLDFPVTVLSWPFTIFTTAQWSSPPSSRIQSVLTSTPLESTAIKTRNGLKLAKIIQKACSRLIAASQEITELDKIAGDGDCGISISKGAQSILNEINLDQNTSIFKFDHASHCLSDISIVLEQNMGGSSGALYCLFLDACAKFIGESPTLSEWSVGLNGGLDAIMLYGGAKPGDYSMIDAIYPALQTLKQDISANLEFSVICRNVSKAARSGAEETKNFGNSKVGRSVYQAVGALSGVADPGAIAIAVLIESLVDDLLQ